MSLIVGSGAVPSRHTFEADPDADLLITEQGRTVFADLATEIVVPRVKTRCHPGGNLVVIAYTLYCSAAAEIESVTLGDTECELIAHYGEGDYLGRNVGIAYAFQDCEESVREQPVVFTLSDEVNVALVVQVLRATKAERLLPPHDTKILAPTDLAVREQISLDMDTGASQLGHALVVTTLGRAGGSAPRVAYTSGGKSAITHYANILTAVAGASICTNFVTTSRDTRTISATFLSSGQNGTNLPGNRPPDGVVSVAFPFSRQSNEKDYPALDVAGDPPAITTPQLDAMNVEVPFEQHLQVTGTPPFRWLVESGELPDGMDLSPFGEITGLPETEQDYEVVIKVESGFGASTIEYSGTVGPPLPPMITTQDLGLIELNGATYNNILEAFGSVPVTWEIANSSGAPWDMTGLELDPDTGQLSGVWKILGDYYSFVVTATNAYGSHTRMLNGKVVSKPTMISPWGDLATMHAGVQYSQQLQVPYYATAPITWLVSGGNLPIGLSLDPNTGLISGVPQSEGPYSFTVRASNIYGAVTREYTGAVTGAEAEITTTTLPPMYADVFFAQNIFITGVRPVELVVVDGELPPGIAVHTNPNDLPYPYVLLGEPEEAGEFTFTLRAGNAYGTHEVEYTVEIEGIAPTITTARLPDFEVNHPVSVALAYTGSGIDEWVVHEGDLPPGLELNSATGVISGTPTTSGTYAFTIRASNDFGDGDRTFAAVVLGLGQVGVDVVDTTVIQSLDFSGTGTLTTDDGNTVVVFAAPITLAIGEQYENPTPPSLSMTFGDQQMVQIGEIFKAAQVDIVTNSIAVVQWLTAYAVSDVEAGEQELSITAATTAAAGRALYGAVALNNVHSVIETTQHATDDEPPYTHVVESNTNRVILQAFNMAYFGTPPPDIRIYNQEVVISSVAGLLVGMANGAEEVEFTSRTDRDTWPMGSLAVELVRAEESEQEGVAPTITTDSLDELKVGVAFSQTLAADGTAPFTWAVTDGELPGGLSLNSSTGALTGTPTTAGDYAFTVTATNVWGTDEAELTGSVADVDPPSDPEGITVGAVLEFSEEQDTVTGLGPIETEFENSTLFAIVGFSTTNDWGVAPELSLTYGGEPMEALDNIADLSALLVYTVEDQDYRAYLTAFRLENPPRGEQVLDYESNAAWVCGGLVELSNVDVTAHREVGRNTLSSGTLRAKPLTQSGNTVLQAFLSPEGAITDYSREVIAAPSDEFVMGIADGAAPRVEFTAESDGASAYCSLDLHPIIGAAPGARFVVGSENFGPPTRIRTPGGTVVVMGLLVHDSELEEPPALYFGDEEMTPLIEPAPVIPGVGYYPVGYIIHDVEPGIAELRLEGPGSAMLSVVMYPDVTGHGDVTTSTLGAPLWSLDIESAEGTLVCVGFPFVFPLGPENLSGAQMRHSHTYVPAIADVIAQDEPTSVTLDLMSFLLAMEIPEEDWPEVAAMYPFPAIAVELTTDGVDRAPELATERLFETSNLTTTNDLIEGQMVTAVLNAYGTRPFAWSIVDGELPDGLSLTDSAISGTVTAEPGPYSVTLRATNSEGYAERTFTGVIVEAAD